MRVYFDHNATTPVDPAVVEAMVRVLRSDNNDFGNPSSIHQFGQRAKGILDEARTAVADLIRAEASEIVVELRMGPSSVTVQVRDDGRGFVVPDRLDDFTRAGHFGLVGLVERVEHADGEITVKSSPGMGATLTVRIPIREAESDERIDSRADRR